MGNFFDFQEKLAASKQKARDDVTAAQSKAARSTGGREQLTVSQLTRMIESAIQTGVPSRVLVSGEISNANLHRASGHLYFTLKDNNCCIDCAMWKSDLVRLKYQPEDGEAVLVGGSVAVYGVRGRYQLYVKSIEPIGKGALELAYRKLYAKLEAEGLFEVSRKRALPKFPMRIALITSANGAALQDMLKVLNRFAWIAVKLMPAAVQGEGASQQIASALGSLSRKAAEFDVAIVARGGGSLEDLWAFNEEIVARAIVACAVPVVSGIGHEVDVSIADLVADYHAHTPTEAAQIVVGGWRTVKDELDVHALRLRRAMRTLLSDARQRLQMISRHEMFRRPLDRIHQFRQRLDDRQRGLHGAMGARLRRSERALETFDSRLGKHHPRHTLKLLRQKIDALDSHLQAVSPPAVLARGYSLTTLKRGGAIVRSSSQVKPGDALVTRVSDGEIESTVEDQKQQKLFE